jgi:hypothetical protein
MPTQLFVPGKSGNPNGRPKIGKKLDVIERLKKDGFDLLGAFIHLAMGKELDFDRDENGKIIHNGWNMQQLKRMDWANEKLLERAVPALRAVEHSTKEGESYGLTVVFGSNQIRNEEENIIIDANPEQ